MSRFIYLQMQYVVFSEWLREWWMCCVCGTLYTNWNAFRCGCVYFMVSYVFVELAYLQKCFTISKHWSHIVFCVLLTRVTTEHPLVLDVEGCGKEAKRLRWININLVTAPVHVNSEIYSRFKFVDIKGVFKPLNFRLVKMFVTFISITKSH